MENESLVRFAAAGFLMAAVAFYGVSKPDEPEQNIPVYQIQFLSALKAFCPERIGQPSNDRLNCFRRGRGTAAGTTVFLKVPEDQYPDL